MAASQTTAGAAVPPEAAALELRLERGELQHYPTCPFALPRGDDLQFLLQQRIGFRAHKNISLDPATGRLAGFRYESAVQSDRLRKVLTAFSQSVTDWLAATLPRYAQGWRPDRVSYQPEEEATRALRMTARNDLLHIDNFPTRPTRGWRILRVFANINPSEPRVWVTSVTFPRLLARFGEEVGLPGRQRFCWWRLARRTFLRLVRPDKPVRGEYDEFMIRLHDYLKGNDEFQERGPKRFWTFAPGAAWMAFTDSCSYAVLRGRYALEHSFFVSPEVLALPDEAPAALLAKASRPLSLVQETPARPPLAA
jgi:hypothetical protein